MKCFLFVLCTCSLVLLSTVSRSCADYYKYTDGNGVVSMTNNLKSVPAKYRSSMQVIHEDKKDPAPQSQAQQAQEEAPETAAAPAPAPQSKFAQLSQRYPWFKPLTYVACALALFLCLIKITSLIPSPLLVKVIYLACTLGVITFLYKSYSESVAEKSQKLKTEAASIVKKSADRQESMAAGALGSEPQK